MRVQLPDHLLQLFELLPGLAEFTRRRQPLIIVKVLACLHNQRIQVLLRAAAAPAGAVRRRAGAVSLDALSDETPPPNNDDSAASKVGP